MRARIAAWTTAVLVAGAACSTFSSNDAPTTTGASDASALPGSDGGAPPPASDAGLLPDAATPDFGCPGKYRADLASAPAAPFDPHGQPSFTFLADDAGPFARAVTPTALLADGAPPALQQYGMTYSEPPPHMCLSTRMRVVTPPPDGVFMSELNTLSIAAGIGFGAGGVEHVGRDAYYFTGYLLTDGGGGGAPKVQFPLDGAWHVFRLEMRRDDAGPWLMDVFLDGARLMNGAVASPPDVPPTNGGIFMGPSVSNPLKADAGDAATPAVVDYADLRIDLE